LSDVIGSLVARGQSLTFIVNGKPRLAGLTPLIGRRNATTICNIYIATGHATGNATGHAMDNATGRAIDGRTGS
jgi:hypothetical protein